ALERTAAVLQSQLREVGLSVDVVALDLGSLVAQWGKGAYDAMYFYVRASATDPSRNQEIWLSSGSFHFWNPGQAKAATPWEAHIDDLLHQQDTTMDQARRRQLFADVQRTLADHVPLVCFAAPTVTVAMSARVRGAKPSVLQPPVLWNAEALWVTSQGS